MSSSFFPFVLYIPYPPEGEECETSVQHGLPLWAEPAVGCCSRRPRPSPMWGSRFVGTRAVGPWVGEQKPLGKTPQWGNPSPESTYLPTSRISRNHISSSTSTNKKWGRQPMDKLMRIRAKRKNHTINANTFPFLEEPPP